MRPSFPEVNGESNYNISTLSTPSKSSSSADSLKAKRSMEDVWEDLDCLQDSPRNLETNTKNLSSLPCVILQDFWARPSGQQDPPSTTTNVSSDDFINSVGPRPATILSLNSGFDSQSLANAISTRKNPHFGTTSFRHSSLNNSPFDYLGSSSSAFPPSILKERCSQNQQHSGDRRHKRMIKNRESAARSRARKQAYTEQLELEASRLREENARLRMQQQEAVADQAQVAKKNKLYRTSTAPF